MVFVIEVQVSKTYHENPGCDDQYAIVIEHLDTLSNNEKKRGNSMNSVGGEFVAVFVCYKDNKNIVLSQGFLTLSLFDGSRMIAWCRVDGPAIYFRFFFFIRCLILRNR